MPQQNALENFVDDLKETASDLAPYAILAIAFIASGGTSAIAAAGSRIGATAAYTAARGRIAQVAAQWAASDLPQAITPLIKRVISEYGVPAGRQVLKDLGDKPLTSITVDEVKGAIVKRFGAASEKAIFKETTNPLKSYLKTVRANPKDQRGVVNFLVNEQERKQMFDNAGRRITFALKEKETLGSNTFGNKSIRFGKKAVRFSYDYGISPTTNTQRFFNSYGKGFTRAFGGYGQTDLLSLIPGKKTFLVRKYYASYRKYINGRLLFGKPAKTKAEIFKQFATFLKNEKYYTPEVFGQATGYASGALAYNQGKKLFKDNQQQRRAKGGSVQVRSYYRDGKQVKSHTRTARN